MIVPWPVDRSRYEAGFTCPWRRLLGYHANYTGVSPKVPNFYLLVGTLIHQALESYLTPPAHFAIPKVEAQPGAAGNWDSDVIQLAQDQVDASVLGWIRTTCPWLKDNFDILGVEQEMNLDLPNPDLPIRWMARPDLVCRHKKTGRLSVHDFKTQGSWQDRYLVEWGDSLQLMMNAHVASQHYKEPVPEYYVHFIVRGTKDYTTNLTHAYYRPPNPPLESEGWSFKKPYGRNAIGFSKIRVANQLPLKDWISKLPSDILSKYFIVGGPFQVNLFKVRLFLESLLANEWWWKESLGIAQSHSLTETGKDWDLDNPQNRIIFSKYFPRTYNCYTYNSRCSYYDLCLKPETKWQDRYQIRKPHHPQEGEPK